MTNEIGAHVFDLRVTGGVLLSREECCVTFWGATSERAPARYASLYNAFGKPELSPEFGSRLRFNLSHSADLALIALTTEAGIGVDLEYIRPQPDYVEIARSFFSAAEVDQLNRLPSPLHTLAFFSCWTKKEAYVKACGEGLAIPLTSFSVPLEPSPGDRHRVTGPDVVRFARHSPVTSAREAHLRTSRRSSVSRDVQAIQRALGSIARGLARLAPALEAAARDSSNPSRGGRKLRLSAARRAALKLQGRYIGYLRSLKSRQKAEVKALRSRKGVRVAISFAKKLARTARD